MTPPPRSYVALLRAISNVAMRPFRDGLEELGFRDVESYGTSGNLLFNSRSSDKNAIERRLTKRLGVPAIVRSRTELARGLKRDPYGSSFLFLARTPTPARRRDFLRLDFEGQAPVLHGKTLFFAYPVKVRGKRTPLDLERALGVMATFRSARVVRRIHERMAGHA